MGSFGKNVILPVLSVIRGTVPSYGHHQKDVIAFIFLSLKWVRLVKTLLAFLLFLIDSLVSLFPSVFKANAT
jgi:hypothetical protein